MSIFNAIKSAYCKGAERNWDKVYWALDLHGTCIDSTYEKHVYRWLTPGVKDALIELCNLQETHLILWSSVHPDEQAGIVSFFESEGIRITGFNFNPFEASNAVSCFDSKFYMSIIVDDKAGFDPLDWPTIPAFVESMRQAYPPRIIEDGVAVA